MMVLPLLIIVLLPKVVNTNDPEMRKVGNLFYFLFFYFLWNLIFFRKVINTISLMFLFSKCFYSFMVTICFLYIADSYLFEKFKYEKIFSFFLRTLQVNSYSVVLLSFQEIEQSMNMLSPNPELPDVSELVTKFFSGSKGSSKAGGSSKGTRPAVKRR